MKIRHGVAIGATVLTVALTGVAFADSGHDGHGQGGGMGMHMGHMAMQRGAHGGAMRHGQNAEEHLATLKNELKLTSKQESAWQTFEQTVRSQKTAHEQGHKPAQAGVDPMESRIAFMEQRLAGMKAVSKARQDLYKVLTPEQKAVADRFFSGQHA